MSEHRQAFLVLLIAVGSASLLAAESALAQDHGCPWCVSPTTCDTVKEDTEVVECWVSGTCHEVSGDCAYIPLLAAGEHERSRILRSAGLEYRGTRRLNINGIGVDTVELSDGLLVRWDCVGNPTDVFRLDDEGEANVEVLRVESYADRLRVSKPGADLVLAGEGDPKLKNGNRLKLEGAGVPEASRRWKG